MYKRIVLVSMVVTFCIAWSGNPGVNTPVSVANMEQKRPQAAPDGNGGAVIVWEDSRRSADYDIYAQFLDASGAPKWVNNGAAICSASGQQRCPQVVADGAGGFIITWYDRRNGKNYDIYAQRIDMSGKVLWEPNGVSICSADDNQYDPTLIADGFGGAIIVWQDRRNGYDYDIYAQRVDLSGKVNWSADGIVICNAKDSQDNPRLISDGSKGAVITWQDRRNGKNYDIYAQKLDSSGGVRWITNGVPVCVSESDQRGPQALSDGNGGAVIAWQDKRQGSDYKIYAQCVNSSGAAKWASNGVIICVAENSQYDPRLVSDGRGGAIIAWQDYRKGGECNFDAFAQQADVKSEVCMEKQLHDWSIFIQSIDSSGKLKWIASGVAVCAANSDQYRPQLVSDGAGGAIIVWKGGANKENNFNIYAQRVLSTGAVKWSVNGAVVSTASGEKFDPVSITNGKGGAIIAWYDKRKGSNCDIYAQSICVSGVIGNCK